LLFLWDGRLKSPAPVPDPFALDGISEALAQEMKPLGIKVLIVEPGQFRTDLARRLWQWIRAWPSEFLRAKENDAGSDDHKGCSRCPASEVRGLQERSRRARCYEREPKAAFQTVSGGLAFVIGAGSSCARSSIRRCNDECGMRAGLPFFPLSPPASSAGCKYH
jgi:hypothetical protein